jgi:hypothetical protein
MVWSNYALMPAFGKIGGERLLLVAISELTLCIASAPTTLGRKGRLIRDEGRAGEFLWNLFCDPSTFLSCVLRCCRCPFELVLV